MRTANLAVFLVWYGYCFMAQKNKKKNKKIIQQFFPVLFILIEIK